MRSAEDFDAVLKCIAAGMTDASVEMQTGVPRGTVSHWRRRPVASKRSSGEIPCGTVHDPSFLPASDYCYLLGLYLGDGCISRMKRVWRLRIVLDARYAAIIDECRKAINSVMHGQEAAVLHRTDNSVEVSMYSKHWPCVFPQHGPGKKHHRSITLEQWQLELVAKAPEDLIRGLIHSDGCRVVANDRGVKSVRYHFTNFSEDILGIFTDTLDRLGIPWTRPTKRMVAIYRKAATARLDQFVGPKT
jgi:hypothetical protein